MAELTELQKQLFELQDIKYRDFHSKLMPETAKEKIIGIRTPVLRNFAKVFAGTPELEDFLHRRHGVLRSAAVHPGHVPAI